MRPPASEPQSRKNEDVSYNYTKLYARVMVVEMLVLRQVMETNMAAMFSDL